MNLKIRFKDPMFIIQLLSLVFGIIVQAVAISFDEITTWAKLGEVIRSIFANPYLLGTIIFNLAVGLINLFRDPTTSGINDSARAQTYESVNSSDIRFGVQLADVVEESNFESVNEK